MDSDVNLIKTVRRLREISQARLAEVIGRSQTFVSLFERGRAGLTDVERRKIEKFLDLDAVRHLQARVLKRHDARR